MRILTLSAYYPPYSYGGYENRVRDVMDGLAARGHEVTVLTTKPDTAMQATPIEFAYPVIRRLHGVRKALSWAERLTMKESTNRLGVALVFLRQIWRDLRDLRLIDNTIKKFQPDIIYLGHIRPLSENILPYLASSSIKLVQDDGGITAEWSYENQGLWFRFLTEIQPDSTFVKKLKAGFVSVVTTLSGGRIKKKRIWPENITVFFNNQACYLSFIEKQIPHSHASVIHSGLDTKQFTYQSTMNSGQVFRVIVPGRIEPNKGQMDAVNLSAQLLQNGIDHYLTIAGDPWKKDYLELLEQEVTDRVLRDHVCIIPSLEKNELIDLYHQSDLCFFPSYHKTGFSRIPLEAMACGCLVISYGNEGSAEIIRENENGFLVKEGNSTQLLQLLQRLIANPAEIERVTKAARQEVEQVYSLPKYLDQIESLLQWISNQR